MQQVEALLAAGKRVPARKLLSDLYWRGDTKTRESAQAILERMNKEMVFNPRNTEGAKVHAVQQGEVLATIAKKYGVNWRMIARLNNIQPDSGFIRVGQPLKVLPGQQRILVDQSDFTLALFIDGHFIKQYRVGLGKDGKTPMGEFVIEQMLIQPDWYPPEGGVIKYGEKGHVIGERWIGFKNQPGATGIGIHGTSEPQTIGAYCSNGCIRMNNEDVIELYDFVSPGTRVTIVP
jgi:lipoprotein-anchoring transpeptidase ErfK/SrfK